MMLALRPRYITTVFVRHRILMPWLGGVLSSRMPSHLLAVALQAGIPPCHHENTLRKLAHAIYRDFLVVKNENLITKLDFFLIFAQNIDCGYTLEPPQGGSSNEYPQCMF